MPRTGKAAQRLSRQETWPGAKATSTASSRAYGANGFSTKSNAPARIVAIAVVLGLLFDSVALWVATGLVVVLLGLPYALPLILG